MEVFDHEPAVEVAISPQHPFDLGHCRAAQPRRQVAVGQHFQSAMAAAVPPASERVFADAKQFRHLQLDQFRSLRAAQDIREPYLPYPLVKACRSIETPIPRTTLHRTVHELRNPDRSRAVTHWRPQALSSQHEMSNLLRQHFLASLERKMNRCL